MPYTIRKATTADVPKLVEIIRTAFQDVALRFGLTEDNCPKHPSNCQGAWITSALEKDVRYFILDSEAISCGCVALDQVNPETCYLESLAVLPQQRRHGFGRALVEKVLLDAMALGAHRVEIGIIAEHIELRDWYRKIGFVEQKTATYSHLPFAVLFMLMKLEAARQNR